MGEEVVYVLSRSKEMIIGIVSYTRFIFIISHVYGYAVYGERLVVRKFLR